MKKILLPLFAWVTGSKPALAQPIKIMKRTSIRMFAGILPTILLGLLYSTCPSRAASGTVVAWGAMVVQSELTNTIAIAGGLGYSLSLNSHGTVVGWASD